MLLKRCFGGSAGRGSCAASSTRATSSSKSRTLPTNAGLNRDAANSGIDFAVRSGGTGIGSHRISRSRRRASVTAGPTAVVASKLVSEAEEARQPIQDRDGLVVVALEQRPQLGDVLVAPGVALGARHEHREPYGGRGGQSQREKAKAVSHLGAEREGAVHGGYS